MIYFLRTESDRIKIGSTDDIWQRLVGLRYVYGDESELIGVMDGCLDDEYALHRQFSRLRLGRTELFMPEPELLEFIHRHAGPVPPNPKTSERDDVTVKIDRDVKATAQYVADKRRIPLAQYISEIVGPIAESDFEKLSRRS